MAFEFKSFVLIWNFKLDVFIVSLTDDNRVIKRRRCRIEANTKRSHRCVTI